MLRIVFEFSAARPFIGGNHLHGTNPKTGRRFLTPEAREQKYRLTLIAQAAARQAQWVMPDYVYAELYGVNVDADGDNLSKPICDYLEKSAYYTDRRIKERRIISMRDKGTPRIIIAVQEVDGKEYGYGKPSKRKI